MSDIKKILLEFKPDAFVLSHPNDHHPDHSATYFIGLLALEAAHMDSKSVRVLLPLDAFSDELEIGLNENRVFTEPKDLPSPTHWFEINLTPQEIKRKTALIRAHESQFAEEYPQTTDPKRFGNHSYMFGYVGKNELFGVLDQLVVDEKFQKRVDRREFVRRVFAAIGNAVMGLFH